MAEYNYPDQIELRSEPVREIMGKVPSYIIRSGIGIIFFVIICLIICSCFIKYPQNIAATVTIERIELNSTTSNYIAIIKYPVNFAEKIKLAQQVNIKLYQYPYMEYGQITGNISKIRPHPIIECSNTFYIAEVNIGNQIKTNTNHVLKDIEGLSGTADIIISTKPLIYRLISPIQEIFN